MAIDTLKILQTAKESRFLVSRNKASSVALVWIVSNPE